MRLFSYTMPISLLHILCLTTWEVLAFIKVCNIIHLGISRRSQNNNYCFATVFQNTFSVNSWRVVTMTLQLESSDKIYFNVLTDNKIIVYFQRYPRVDPPTEDLCKISEPLLLKRRRTSNLLSHSSLIFTGAPTPPINPKLIISLFAFYRTRKAPEHKSANLFRKLCYSVFGTGRA